MVGLENEVRPTRFGHRLTVDDYAYMTDSIWWFYLFWFPVVMKPRRAKEHVRWLKAQGFKEYSAIKPIVAALVALHPNIDRGIDRHEA